MVDFKVVLSDPKTGLSYKIDATGAAAGALLGKKIGTEVDGAPFGLNGYKITITGGSDKTGTPARKERLSPGKRTVSGGLPGIFSPPADSETSVF